MDFYLPDECWESVFRLIIINDNNNDLTLNQQRLYDRYCNKHRYLNCLSLVSKQFLSITNRLRFSITINKQLKYSHIFKRFTNLTSLNLNGLNNNGYHNNLNLNEILYEISCFPLKHLTSLNISVQRTFPANGLRAFSQKITTLTSLTCFSIWTTSSNNSDLFLIAECFPLLEQLDLSYSSDYENYGSYDDGMEALSLALIQLRKVNLTGYLISHQSLFHLFNNCKYLEEVIIIFESDERTSAGLASALRVKPTLRSLSFSCMKDSEVFGTPYFIDSLVSLKGLTCLVLQFLNISDELLYSIAREGLPLTRFVLKYCRGHSYAGIICLISKCQRIQHLDLPYTDFLNDQHVVELSSFLVDLVSIDLGCCKQLTKSALFTLAKNCPSLSEIKMERIGGKIVGNSESLLEFGVHPQLKSLYLGMNSWLSDEIITMFASIFPNLQLLDLKLCNKISEGICQVLRKCCKIRHLNLTYCLEVKLHEMDFVVPNLEVLKLSSTKVDDETLYLISKNCRGLLQLFLRECNVTKKGVKHVLENCTLLRDHGYISSSHS